MSGVVRLKDAGRHPTPVRDLVAVLSSPGAHGGEVVAECLAGRGGAARRFFPDRSSHLDEGASAGFACRACSPRTILQARRSPLPVILEGHSLLRRVWQSTRHDPRQGRLGAYYDYSFSSDGAPRQRPARGSATTTPPDRIELEEPPPRPPAPQPRKPVPRARRRRLLLSPPRRRQRHHRHHDLHRRDHRD